MNYVQAIDEIFARFKTEWAKLPASIVGYVPNVEWQGKKKQTPDASRYWLRVSQKTAHEGQTAFRSGEHGQRYTTDGLLFIQVFCPKGDVDAFQKGRLLSQFARNIFRGHTTPGGVTFNDVTIKELEDENDYKRFNVVSEYEYDEIS